MRTMWALLLTVLLLLSARAWAQSPTATVSLTDAQATQFQVAVISALDPVPTPQVDDDASRAAYSVRTGMSRFQAIGTLLSAIDQVMG